MSRLQLELPDHQLQDLKQLISESNGTLKSYTDLFNSACTLLKWAIRERSLGRIIVSMDEASGKYKELSMPVLEANKRPMKDSFAGVHYASIPMAAVMGAATKSKGSE